MACLLSCILVFYYIFIYCPFHCAYAENSTALCFRFPERTNGRLTVSAIVLRCLPTQSYFNSDGRHSCDPHYGFCYQRANEVPSLVYKDYKPDPAYRYFECDGKEDNKTMEASLNMPGDSQYYDIAMDIFIYTALSHPGLFSIGNITHFTISDNIMCVHHDGDLHNFTQYQSDGVSTYIEFKRALDHHLEWVRPFFSCWLVLFIAFSLRSRTTASLAGM